MLKAAQKDVEEEGEEEGEEEETTDTTSKGHNRGLTKEVAKGRRTTLFAFSTRFIVVLCPWKKKARLLLIVRKLPGHIIVPNTVHTRLIVMP